MAEEIAFENGRNSNFEGLMTLTLTFDLAIRDTVVHHSSTSTCIQNFIEIEETFCGRTDGRTDGRTFFPPLILLGRLLEVDLIMYGVHPPIGSKALFLMHDSRTSKAHLSGKKTYLIPNSIKWHKKKRFKLYTLTFIILKVTGNIIHDT